MTAGPESDPLCALQERARAERDAGRFGAAEATLRRALELLEARGEGRHPDAANLRCELAALLAGRRRDDEAERLAREALALLDELLAEAAPEDLTPDVLEPLERIRIEALAQLATSLRGQGRYDAAQAPCREALRRTLRLLGPRSLETAARLNDLGVLWKYAGRLERAARAYGRARAVLARHPRADPALLATLTYNLGGLAHARGDFAGAEPLAREALRRLARALGDRHPDVGAAWATLGAILQGAGKLDEASAAYERARAVVEAAYGAEHPDVALVLANASELERARGRLARAEELGRRALELRRAALGPQHPQVATSLNNLALLVEARGRLAEAATLLREARQACAARAGADHPSTRILAANLAALERRLSAEQAAG